MRAVLAIGFIILCLIYLIGLVWWYTKDLKR